MAIMNRSVEDLIVRSRVRMLLKAPFFGALASRLTLIDASEWCPTAATDGRHLYYNATFIKSLSKQELDFVVAHEVEHCVYDHMGRRNGRDPRLWNCAGDYVINLELVEQRIGQPPTKVGILLEKEYANMYAEEVYEILVKKTKAGKLNKDANSFDMHMDPSKSSGKAGDGKTDPTGKTGPIPISDNDRKALSDEIKQAVLQAAKAAGAGNVPGGVKRMITDITNPQMDWRQLLPAQIQSCYKSDYTFQRPNRKTQMSDVKLPGMNSDQALDVAIGIDNSGSISITMIRDFLGEVQGIMEQFNDFTVRIWTFDTQVYNFQTFTPNNIDELLEYEILGGGGTSFEVNYEFMKEHDIEPDMFVMMTDGYPCGTWGDPDYCDTLFLIHGTTSIVAPFGITTYYTEPTKK